MIPSYFRPRMSVRASKIALCGWMTTMLAIIAACGTPRPPLPPSLGLPKPVTDLRASRKADKVSLSWTVPVKTTDKTNLRHLGPTLVCRSLEVAINRCDPVGTVQASEVPPAQPGSQKTVNGGSKEKGKNVTSPVTATYTDVLLPKIEELNPTGFVTYAVETQNTNLRSAGLSNEVRIPLVPTLDAPTDLAGTVNADGVVLTWTSALPELQAAGVSYTYRLYRRDQATKAVMVAGELPVSLAAQPKFVDSGMEWQKTYEYWITVVSVLNTSPRSALQVEGDNSPPITITVNDVFPPAQPNGLQAVGSGEGQQPFIDLTWAPNTESDLAGYNIYRREPGTAEWTKLNSKPVTVPVFRDTDVVRGNEYAYAVSAVDLRNNESARSEEVSETVR